MFEICCVLVLEKNLEKILKKSSYDYCLIAPKILIQNPNPLFLEEILNKTLQIFKTIIFKKSTFGCLSILKKDFMEVYWF